jgi:hypothetical protein
MYFKILWKSWNWPLYTRECLRYWLPWHLVVEMSSWIVKYPRCATQYYQWWMWRQSGFGP